MKLATMGYICQIIQDEDEKFKKVSPIHKIKDGSCVVMSYENQVFLITVRELKSQVTVPDFPKLAQSILN